MNIPVVVLGDTAGQYIQAIERQRGAINVVRHVQELSDLIGIAHSGIARVALLVSGYEDLTASLVHQLSESQVITLIIADPGEAPHIAGAHTISSLTDTQELLNQIEQITFTEEYKKDDEHHQEPEKREEDSPHNADKEPQDEGPYNAKILTVWGGAGSPGRSTIATNLAVCATQEQEKVCLIDADTYAPSVSALLGMLEDYSGLAQLCHLADRATLTSENIHEIITTIKIEGGYLDVITGITRSDRWPEIRSQAFELLLTTLRQNYDLIIIDTGFCIEEDEEITFDGVAPSRNAATHVALESADNIILLGSADVLGIPRLLRSYEELQEFQQRRNLNATVDIWVNKVRPNSVGNRPEEKILQAWQRFGPEKPIRGFISHEPSIVDKCALSGKTVVEVSKQSPMTQTIRNMLSTLTTGEEKSAQHANQEGATVVSVKRHDDSPKPPKKRWWRKKNST
ncbi:AAA family ATPase [Rothia sp. CCM 9419]|uniref:AAA family ATPase n=1 Tax=Rothia sp. CCM 9419 TaxID=3402662 RepID=UPI003AE2CCF5